MSKYKFLILILMVIKSLYYSEAIDFTDILRAKEVDGVFIKRMTERGLPIVGELYSEYQTRFNNNGQSASIISKEEYQILMDSIPRINESLESIKTRNDKINKEGSHVVHSFQQEDIDALKLYYPRVYETDIEYVRRLWRNNSVPFPLPKTIFKLLKSYCPNIGEIHNEYLEDRKNDFGIGGYSEQEFTVFLESYPTILENDATFLKRIGLESLGLDESNSSEYYLGLWSLIPIYAETYKEYSDRMKLKELVPMKRESFVFYQAYYPNLCVRYYDFKNQLSTYEQTEPRFQKLKFIIYSLKTYNHFKTKFPRPFESQKIFDNRSIDDSGYLHFIFKSSFAKRMYPKMTETYEDYLIRIALLDLKPIPEEYFIEYKKNYPQIHIAYDKIGFQYGKNENKKLQKESLLEIMMDEPEFGLLIRRLPIIYENYSMYRERITMLELLKFEEKEKKKTKYSHINSVTGEFDRSIKSIIEDDLTTGYDVEKTDPDYLDEEDFEDLKKVYINQCEIYKDYEIRMAQMHIIPMTIDIAKHFKMSVPREYEEYDGSYYDAIFNSDSNEFMKNNPNEYCFEFHWIQIFPDENYRTFLFVRPHLFENYENYVIRINTFRENYDFHDYTELKHLEQDTFRTFIQPLTKDEFSDLKLRFPKLSETPNDYEYRLRKEYGIKTVIVKNRFNLFNIIKQSQIQPCDNFEIYERRYNKLVINKKKHLQNLGILLLDIYQFNLFKKSLPTTPYEVDYSKYNEEMNKIRNKYKLDEEDYKDYMSVFPKYYDTFVEYNERMKNLYLDEIKFKDFEILKEVHPHFLDKDFDEYQCNHKSYKMTKEQYDLWFLSVPKPYESFKTYQTRVPNISDEIYKSGDFDRYKQIYPPASSTADEYFQLLESLGLPKIGSNVHSFNTYKKHLPIFKVDHTGKAPLYKDYTKSFENPKSYKMTKEQYDLWFLRLPKAHERYSSYEQRIKRIKKNNPPEVQPLEKYEFHDLKKLFSIPYETFEEHTSRLQRYGLIPLTVIQFKHEKAGRVLVGESYNSHVERILRLFSGDSIVIMDKEETLNNIKDEGVETLCPTIFVEHVLTYPFNYDTYEMFLSRQNKIKSELEPDPLVKTEIWYTTMKSLLPRINETIEKFKERVKTYDLDFPEITVTDFYRHKYTMPYPAESYSTFYERTNPDFFPIDPFSDNKILKVIPIPIPVQAENDTTVKWSPPKSKKSVRTVHARTSAIDTERPKHFQLCPVLNGFLKNYKRELYNNFIALSPNFVIDYKNYHDKVKKSNGEPLKLEEFYEFKRCIPKLQESILEYNNYMKSIGLAEIEVEGYNKLKIFYPRIHHISYNNYILDIELKFGKEAHDYRGVIDALKLSSNEFDVYKEYFPLLFDFTYTTYRTRKKHEDESKLFEMDEFNIIKKANLPLPDENYEQHKENMDYLAIDPIPNDVFLFLKGLYPELFDTRYKFRIMEMVCKELQHVNYNDDKYKLDNEIVSKIIKKSNPSKEQHDKVQTLMKHMLNDEDFKHLISHFPRVFQPYSSREDFMDEKLFKSFKKAYFPLINETYMEYTTRMKSLNLTAISSNIFRYIKSIYPQMYFQTTYLQKVKFYETHELRFVKASVTETLQRLGYEKFNQYNYDIFLNNIPRIFDSHTYFEKCVVKDQMPSIFNFDEFDSVKSAYYPRLSENYNSYRVRMVSIGLWMSNYEIFKSFKAVYPTPMMSYDEYKTAFNKKNGHKYKIKTQHIMTEKEFGNNLMNDFPRLFESWEEFYERRLPTSSEDTENRLINDDGIFSKNLFNDMKIVYLPKLGENVETFVLLNTETLNLSCDRQYWTKYFRNVMKLYPIFFESYADYKNRLKTRSECELEYLKLNEKWFYRFFQIFPFPYETYPQYTTRNVKETTYILSEEEFIYFRRVFPLLTETYIEYTARMNSNLCIQFVTKEIFVLFKLLFPQIDEDYDTYKKRFYNSLINSDDETKKQLSLFVQYMKFHAFDYKTSQDTEITPETSGDMNTAIITSEITDIAAETSGTTSVKIYGAMTFEEFKVFKLSLPIPNERRDDYIIRINKLASLAKRDGIKEHVEPEILPEELYQNLFDSYPKETNRNYDDYLENMECKNSIPVSRDTFDKLLKVSNSMDYNPYTFDYSSFYKIIVTSKDQLSYPSWPWYVDSGKQN